MDATFGALTQALGTVPSALETSALSNWIRLTPGAFGIIEAAHVVGVAMVVGTILFVDLRLLGIPSTDHPFSPLATALLRWTWSAFAVVVLSGSAMFITSATQYLHNVPFRIKMLVMLVAGINMMVFQLLTHRRHYQWDVGPTPASAKAAALISLLAWTSVIVLGRWIGFTKGFDTQVDLHTDFSQFQ